MLRVLKLVQMDDFVIANAGEYPVHLGLRIRTV